MFKVGKYCCLSEGKALLADLGCGPGHNADALMREGVASTAVLLDISPTMVVRALTEVREGIPLGVCGDMVYAPLRDGCVDVVLMIASLHHVVRREARLGALKESFRILKGGGTALIVVWARWQVRLLPLLIKGLVRYALKQSETPWDVVRCSKKGQVCREYHLYSLKELVNDARQAGFSVVESGTYVAPGREGLPRKNYYVIGIKPKRPP